MQTEANINTSFEQKVSSFKGDIFFKEHIKLTESNNNVVKFFIKREKNKIK